MSNGNMTPVAVSDGNHVSVNLDNVPSMTTVGVKGATKVNTIAIMIVSVVGVLGLVTTAIFVPLAVTHTGPFATSVSTSSSVSSTVAGSTTVATTTVATTTTAGASSQCSSYTTINDATRLQTAAGGSACDQSLFSVGAGTWVRFNGAGGTQLATSSPGTNFCGTQAPGWYSGSLPVSGATANATVCFTWGGNTCTWSIGVLATNCGSFYVYYLLAPPTCSTRYCTQ